MKITIAHLYYDLLNLYGESGNVKALKKSFEDLNIDTEVRFLTIDDELEFDKYDIVYLGMGTNENIDIVLKHLLTYKKEIKKYIESDRYIFATGNSYELFGKYILDNDKKISTLNIFNYYSKREVFRMVDECLFKCNDIDNLVLGFQNRDSVIKDNDQPYFEVIEGIGSYPNSKEEGYHYKNFYGTYLVGPLFIRNPYFLKHVVTKIVKEKDQNFVIKDFDLDIEINAYNEFIKNFHEH